MLCYTVRAAARSSARKQFAVRSISNTVARASDHGPPQPQLFGTGAKPGTVPTDFEQATGLERFALLGRMEGIEVFDTEPLDSSRKGTMKDPIQVFSLVLFLAFAFTCQTG